MDPVESDLTLLRSLVARELETINVYRDLAKECADPVTKAFFLHVVDEEKVHIADTLQAIAVHDLDQAGLLRTGFSEGHAPGEIPVRTVGSLAGRSAEGARSAREVPLQEVDRDIREGREGVQENRDVSERTIAVAWTVGSLRGLPQVE